MSDQTVTQTAEKKPVVPLKRGDFIGLMVKRNGVELYGICRVLLADDTGACRVYMGSSGAKHNMTGIAQSWGIPAAKMQVDVFEQALANRGGKPFQSLDELVSFVRAFTRTDRHA